MNIEWNAKEYTNDFSFVHKYGEDLLSLIDLPYDSKVIDLGCGNGALTAKLNKMGYNATGIDASENMLNIARKNYPDIKFMQADAVTFGLTEKADAVFSNAVFHWIDENKQKIMLRNIANNIKSGGQFIFEFGGKGNNRSIHNALETEFTKAGLEYKFPFYFPSIGEYAPLLEEVGFKVIYMTLFDRMTALQGDDGLYEWIKMFVKKPFEYIDADIREQIIRKAVVSLKESLYHKGIWYADYVRIRCKVIKS